MKTVAVFFGGQSVEHDISIISALLAVMPPLKATQKYTVVPIYIAKNGAWYTGDEFADIRTYQSGDIDSVLASHAPVQVQFDGGLTLVKSSKFAGRKAYTKLDIAFPVMHGTKGEDGSLMGLLEMANVPYVGCGVRASAVAMDKEVSKLLVAAHDIATTPMIVLRDNEYIADMKACQERIGAELQLPVFVKPSSLGSSIGITKVADKGALENAIEVAFHYDKKIIVEEAVHNLVEVTVPVMGNESLEAAIVEQPADPEDGVFDFDKKYLGQGKSGGKKMAGTKQGAQGYSYLPARLPGELLSRAKEVALASFTALGCEGLARVDLLIDTKTKIVYFNELNPMPGSLYAHNWAAHGVSSIVLVERLMAFAQERFDLQRDKQRSFKTNFLKQF